MDRIALAGPSTNSAGHPVVRTRGIAATHRTAERETICQSINFYRRSRALEERERQSGEEGVREMVNARHRNGIESIYLCAGFTGGKGLGR